MNRSPVPAYSRLQVTGKPFIRFYPGIPVREPSGFKIGTLCIIDDKRRLVAEGIESAAVEAKLIELGQGFFYSKPMPLEKALEWASSFTWDNRSNNVEQ